MKQSLKIFIILITCLAIYGTSWGQVPSSHSAQEPFIPTCVPIPPSSPMTSWLTYNNGANAVSVKIDLEMITYLPECPGGAIKFTITKVGQVDLKEDFTVKILVDGDVVINQSISSLSSGYMDIICTDAIGALCCERLAECILYDTSLASVAYDGCVVVVDCD